MSRTETNVKAHFYSFLLAVDDMRKFQKEYFKTRDREILIKSKVAEKKVDTIIEAWKQDKEFINEV